MGDLFNLKFSERIHVFRSILLPLVLILCGCASSSTKSETNSSTRPVCDQWSDCFNQRAVRSFRALNNNSLVAFVGAARCPYLIETEGFFCSLRSSAYIRFDDFDGRICSLDRSYIVGDPFFGQQEYCRVRSIEPLNDDELVEIYSTYGFLEPLPPIGPGELEVIEAPKQKIPTPAITEPGNAPNIDAAETS